MSIIRTYYWHDRVRSKLRLLIDRKIRNRPWTDFAHGNAGDVFAKDLLARAYPALTPKNTSTGSRILCVGSIGHRVNSGDVLCGVGCKTTDLASPDHASVYVHALRGPISLEAFRKAGFDTSTVKFLADPGLLIGCMVPERPAKTGKVIFIPHYRERKEVMARIPAGIDFVDIDAPPLAVAAAIQEAECVFASSLHGVIFSHALGRPCVLVRPATVEPILKYKDYYASVGLDLPTPLASIEEADLATAPVSPARLGIDINDIVFPDEELLKERGIIQ